MTRAIDPVAERRALLSLGLFAILSVLVYLVAFVRPFSLSTLWMSHQLDLNRLGQTDPGARWWLVSGFVAEGLLYYLAWRSVQQIRGRAGWVIVGAGLVLSAAVLLLMYPIGSTDIFDYIIHGRMLALHNANPFVQTAAQYPADLFAWYAGWPYATSAYGPFWEVLAGVTARLAGEGVVSNVIAFKILEGIFLIGSSGMIALILRRIAPERTLAGVLLFAWNPVVLYETLGNGHNDIVMVFWMLAAVRLMLDRRFTMAILALLGGALVKFIPLLMLPAAGLIALREISGWRRRGLFVVVTAVAAAALVVAAYEPFWAGIQVLAISRREQMLTSSLPAMLMAMQMPKLGWEQAASMISRIAALFTAVYALWEGVRAWADRSELSFARSAFNISMFYVLLTCLWLWPWYAIWPLAFAVLFAPGRVLALAEIFVFAVISRPLMVEPFLTWRQPTPSWNWVQMRMGPMVLALPLLYSAYALVNSALERLLGGRQPVQPPAEPVLPRPLPIDAGSYTRVPVERSPYAHVRVESGSYRRVPTDARQGQPYPQKRE